VNGLFNLSRTKAEIAGEILRVLKPGGRLVVSEIVLRQELPEEMRASLTNWFS
jgi:hypothetical protein